MVNGTLFLWVFNCFAPLDITAQPVRISVLKPLQMNRYIRTEREHKMTKAIELKKGINVVGETVTEEIAFTLSDKVAVECEKLIKITVKNAKTDQKNEDTAVSGFALLATEVISELAIAKQIIMIDSIRELIFKAGKLTLTSKDPAYRKVINRSKRGIQCAMLVYKNSDNYRLTTLGDLEATHQMHFSTVILRDDENNIVDAKAQNTLTNNPEDFGTWLKVQQPALDSHMVKNNLQSVKGADNRKSSGNATSVQDPSNMTMKGLGDFVSGKTTNGKTASADSLSQAQLLILADTLHILEEAHGPDAKAMGMTLPEYYNYKASDKIRNDSVAV